jgi:hypothetical protein
MKYKQGDRVKIKEESSHGFEIGTLVTIIELHEDSSMPHYRAESSDGEKWYVDYNDLE